MQRGIGIRDVAESNQPAQRATLESASGAGRDSGAIGAAGLLDIIRWRAKLVGGMVAVGLAAAAVYLIVTPPRYTATAEFLLETDQPSVIERRPAAQGPDAALLESQVDIMRSARIAAQAIQNLDLVEDLERDIAAPGLGGWISETIQGVVAAFAAIRPDSARPDAAQPLDSDEEPDNHLGGVPQGVVKEFLRNLEVQRKGLTYIILVNYTHEDPRRAANAANAVVDSYIAYQLEVRRSAMETASKWLRERIKKLRAEVLEAEENVQRYRTEHNLAAIGGQTLSEREIAETADQLVFARADAATIRAQLGQIERLSADPDQLMTLEDALQSGIIREFRSQFAAARRELSTTVSRYGEQSPQAEAVRTEIEDIRNEIKSEIDRIVQNSRNDYEVVQERVALLEDRLEKIKDDFAQRTEFSVQLAELQREAEATRELYLSYLARSKETEAQASLNTPEVRVVTKAVTPILPSGPKKGLTLGLALAASAALGVAGAVLREQLRPMIRSPQEVEVISGLPHLASLPDIGAKNRLVKLRARQYRRAYGHRLAALESQSSQYAQSILTVANVVKPNGGSAEMGTVVVLVSARSGEGKSTIAANIADYAALSKKKVLLIDCDLRNPSLTAVICGRPKLSLVDILENSADPADVLVSTKPEGLTFCPAPPKGSCRRPAELLASEEMAAFLTAMWPRYDLVIVDTTPILPYVDAQPLINLADVVLCVVEWGKTSHDDLRAAIRRAARTMEGRTAYAVLNKDRS